MEDISSTKLAAGSMVSWRVFDLLRRYELQCSINSGLDSKNVLVMPPYDFFLIYRHMKQLGAIDLSMCSTLSGFELLDSLQKQVGLKTFGAALVSSNTSGTKILTHSALRWSLSRRLSSRPTTILR